MSLWKHATVSAGRRAPAVRVSLAAIVCLGLSAASAAEAPAGARDTARAARVLSVNDTGHLRSGGENGSTLIEEGRVTGTLPGSVRASLTLGATTVRVGFTIYLHGGTITGHAVAALNPGKGEYASFGGTLAVSHGGGRYAHAAGSGRVSGTLNRYSYAATVQVIGQLHY
jgi:hypothetical protein